MKEDFSELVEYLDEKFSGVDTKFDAVGKELGGIITKLENLEETKADKSDVRDLIVSVDAYAAKADKYFQEMAALTAKVDRLEKWIQEVAEKVGVELKSE